MAYFGDLERDGYSIELKWKEQCFYREPGDRRLEFECAWGVQPGEIYVPPPEQWIRWAPPWARGRRAEIVDRLKCTGQHVQDGWYPEREDR